MYCAHMSINITLIGSLLVTATKIIKYIVRFHIKLRASIHNNITLPKKCINPEIPELYYLNINILKTIEFRVQNPLVFIDEFHNDISKKILYKIAFENTLTYILYYTFKKYTLLHSTFTHVQELVKD